MQIKPKTSTSLQKKSDTYSKPMDLSGYISVDSCELTVGKYKGKTWRWVQKNDQQYSTWMKESGVCIQWGCMVEKEQKEVRKYSGFISGAGEHWIGLTIHPGTGRVCLQEWLQ